MTGSSAVPGTITRPHNTGLPDKDQPFNDRGKRDAPEMGERLANRRARPDLILSSPDFEVQDPIPKTEWSLPSSNLRLFQWRR
jgi:hypothetical protein